MSKNKGGGGGGNQKPAMTGFQSSMSVDTMNEDSVPLKKKYAGCIKAMVGGLIAITGMHFLNKGIDRVFGIQEDEDSSGDMVPRKALEGKDRYINQLKTELAELKANANDDSDDEDEDDESSD